MQRIARRLAIASAAASLACVTTAYGQQASPAAFTADMSKRVKARIPAVVITPDPADPLAVHIEGGEWKDAVMNFHRLFYYCQTSSAADCEAVKVEFVDKTTKKTPPVTAASLRLIVRDAEYLAYIRSLKKQPPVIFEQIGEDLYALLASDSADTIAVVPEAELADLGLNRARAWALADKQTRADLPPLPTVEQLKKSAVGYQDQSYLGSLLIDRAAWAKLSAAIGPDLFMTVVSDNFVFVGVMPDGPSLEKFRKTVAEDCAEQQRCISPNLYRFCNGSWKIAR